jgi:hypothetical protein
VSKTRRIHMRCVAAAGVLSDAEKWVRFGRSPLPILAPTGLLQSAIVYAQMRARAP